MAGIADVAAVPLQTGQSAPLIAAQDIVPINSGAPTAPFEDFMAAFRNGTITADDIRKRAVLGTTGAEAEKAQNIATRQGAEQTSLDIGQVRPLQRDLATAQTTGGIAQQTELNDLMSQDPNVRHPVEQRLADRALEKGATEVFGTPQPELHIASPGTPEPFETWVVRQANNFRGTDTARAEYVNRLEAAGGKDGKGSEEYTAYKDAIEGQTQKLDPSDSGYKQELRKRVDAALTHEHLQQINYDTLRELGKAHAEATAKGPVKAHEAEDKLRTEVQTDKEIEQILKSQGYFATAKNILDKPKGTIVNAEDQLLIESFIKLADPAGVIRQSKIEYLRELQPVVSKVKNSLNSLVGDKNAILQQADRDQIAKAIDRLQQGYSEVAKTRLNFYSKLAEQRGANVKNVLDQRFIDVASGKSDLAGDATGAATAAPTPGPRATQAQASGAQTFNALSEVPSNVQFFRDPQNNLRLNPNFTP